MVKEFVGNMGGGLVVLCGPRFGPQQLARTPLADLLPVTVDPAARIRDQEPFKLQLTTQAAGYTFMQLGAGSSLAEMQKAWDNLGLLPWYQPVEGIQPSATVLAEHPTDTCGDGKKQPLIAIRHYGRGEVVYLGFNETWRLRRAHGEELFRRFWKDVMWRLARTMPWGRTSGSSSRPICPVTRSIDLVTLNVFAGNADYKALSENEVPGGKLSGKWMLPAVGTQKAVAQPLTLTQVQPGHFRTSFIVTAPGEHRVRVTDP